MTFRVLFRDEAWVGPVVALAATDPPVAIPIDSWSPEVETHEFTDGVARRFRHRSPIVPGSSKWGGARLTTGMRLAVLCARAIAARHGSPIRPADTGVACALTSSALEAAYQFELRGMREGWDVVDPLLFPFLLPSAPATTLAVALGVRRPAITVALNNLAGIRALARAAEAVQGPGGASGIVVGAGLEIGDCLLRAFGVAGVGATLAGRPAGATTAAEAVAAAFVSRHPGEGQGSSPLRLRAWYEVDARAERGALERILHEEQPEIVCLDASVSGPEPAWARGLRVHRRGALTGPAGALMDIALLEALPGWRRALLLSCDEPGRAAILSVSSIDEQDR